jgi:hypothetical protein
VRITDYKPEINTLSVKEVKFVNGVAFFKDFFIIGKPGSNAIIEFSTTYFDLTSNSFI